MALAMRAFRAILLQKHWLALMVLALALCMKALVPAGFMVEARATSLTVLVCADSTGARSAIEVAIPRADSKHGTDAKSHEACPFSALSLASTGGINPVQLAIALALILLLGVLATPRLRLVPMRRVLPPQCGPPALA